MKKKSNLKFIPVFVVISITVFVGYLFYDKIICDNQAPIITVDSATLTVNIYDGDEALLKGVRAEDNRDGDLTASVIIEKKSTFSGNGERTITYAVVDKSGNIGRATRVIKYEGYQLPIFSLSAPLRYPMYDNYFDLMKYISAESIIDGDLSSKITCSTEFGFHADEETKRDVVYSVTDSTGMTAKLPVSIEFYDKEKEVYTIELSDYLVYIKLGSEFYPEDYYIGSDSGMYPEIESGVDTDTAGVYEVEYTVGREDAHGSSKLVVVVVE